MNKELIKKFLLKFYESDAVNDVYRNDNTIIYLYTNHLNICINNDMCGLNSEIEFKIWYKMIEDVTLDFEKNKLIISLTKKNSILKNVIVLKGGN